MEKHELGHGANARLVRSGLQYMHAESGEKPFITSPPYRHDFGFYFPADAHGIKVANNSQPHLVAGCSTDISEPLQSKAKTVLARKVYGISLISTTFVVIDLDSDRRRRLVILVFF